MKNIHVLGTNKPSRLQTFFNGGDEFELELSPKDSHFNKGTHIFITFDEDIKEGDWAFDGENAYKWTSGDVEDCLYNPGDNNYKGCKKIILTTDPTLIEDGIQAIEDDFLLWFVDNPTCEFVNIQKLYLSNRGVWKEVLLPSEWGDTTEIGYNIVTEVEEEVDCNMCGYLMDLLPDNSIYVCNNSECTSCYEYDSEEDTYLQGFIDQFGDGELGELDPNEWDVLQFLQWLKLNNYEIIKK